MTAPRPQHTRRPHRVASVAALLTLILTAVAETGAHPASDTSVVIGLRNRRTIDVAVASNASALLTKLEALAGSPLSSSPGSRDTVAARLTSLGATLADHSFLAIDGVRVSTRPGDVFVDEGGLATMHLTGQLDDEMRGSLSWSTNVMYGTYPLVLHRSDGQETISWVDGRDSSGPIPIDQLAPSVSIWSGLALGFTHIVPKGLDHILFVLGLFLLCPAMPTWRRIFPNQEPGTRNQNPGTLEPGTLEPNGLRHLVLQVSAFTVAHSITLGLSLYGLVQAPSDVVEPLIALSVAYVGVENLFTSRLHPWRLMVVFSFGLLHGLGFAGALLELPYSDTGVLAMLVSFNLGVEFGQLAVLAGAAVGLWILLAYRQSWQRPAAQCASAAVGLIGLLWTMQRLAA